MKNQYNDKWSDGETPLNIEIGGVKAKPVKVKTQAEIDANCNFEQKSVDGQIASINALRKLGLNVAAARELKNAKVETKEHFAKIDAPVNTVNPVAEKQKKLADAKKLYAAWRAEFPSLEAWGELTWSDVWRHAVACAAKGDVIMPAEKKSIEIAVEKAVEIIETSKADAVRKDAAKKALGKLVEIGVKYAHMGACEANGKTTGLRNANANQWAISWDKDNGAGSAGKHLVYLACKPGYIESVESDLDKACAGWRNS